MTILGASWVDAAVCTETDAERLFGRTGAARAARFVCGRCPVRMECLAHALRMPEEFGVWGGLTPYERHVLRRAFPDIGDWEDTLRDHMEWLVASLDGSRTITHLRVARRLRELQPEKLEQGGYES